MAQFNPAILFTQLSEGLLRSFCFCLFSVKFHLEFVKKKNCLDPNLDDPGYSISCNFVDCISNREMGSNRGFQNMRLTSEYATRHMLSNAMMKECPISQPNMNKVRPRLWTNITMT